MDWPRARAILLLTFLLVNAFLAWRLWGGGAVRPLPESGLAALQVSETRVRLAEQGFRLEADPKPHPPVRPLLRLGPPGEERQGRVVTRLVAVRREPGDLVWRQDGGAVVWTGGSPWGKPPRSGPRGAREAAEAFLRAADLASVADLTWSRSQLLPGGYAVEFVPLRGGLPVYAGWVRVSVGPGGVTRAQVFLPEMEEVRGELKGVLAPTEALLRLAGHLAAAPAVGAAAPAGPLGAGHGGRNGRATFTDVALGYYAPRPPGARSWDAVAVWRVLTGAGDVYYVNAFTGELVTAPQDPAP